MSLVTVVLTAIPLQPAFGTLVGGVDLSIDLSDATREELRALFRARHLLVFRGQSLEGEDQVRVAGWFGPVVDESRDGSFCAYVSNHRSDASIRGNNRLLFHSDLGFTTAPHLGISLYALEIDDDVPTAFADAVVGCRDLPPELRALVGDKKVVNAYDFSPGYLEDTRTRIRDLPPGTPSGLYPHGAFPIIDRHPLTGEEYLRVSAMQSSHLEGLAETESEPLLQRTLAHLYRADHLYEHHWEVGDLVLWDNVALQHGRPAYGGDGRRTLRRVGLHDRTLREAMAGALTGGRRGQGVVPTDGRMSVDGVG